MAGKGAVKIVLEKKIYKRRVLGFVVKSIFLLFAARVSYEIIINFSPKMFLSIFVLGALAKYIFEKFPSSGLVEMKLRKVEGIRIGPKRIKCGKQTKWLASNNGQDWLIALKQKQTIIKIIISGTNPNTLLHDFFSRGEFEYGRIKSGVEFKNADGIWYANGSHAVQLVNDHILPFLK